MKKPAILTAGISMLAMVFFVAGMASAKVHAQSNQNNNQTTQPNSAQTTNKKPEPKIVEVQPGDYLAKIAEANSTTYTRLFDANENIKHPDIIHPGDKIRIPTADEQLASRALPVVAVAPTRSTQPSASARRTAPRAAANFAPGDGSVWDRLAACESGGNWSINTGNGYYGGLQFTPASWRAVGGSGLPSQASREEQISRAQALQARQGWGAWPACSSKLGLR